MISLTVKPTGKIYSAWLDYTSDANEIWSPEVETLPNTNGPIRWITPLLGLGWPFRPDTSAPWTISSRKTTTPKLLSTESLAPESFKANEPALKALTPTTDGDALLFQKIDAAIVLLSQAKLDLGKMGPSGAVDSVAWTWLKPHLAPDIQMLLESLKDHALGALYISETDPTNLKLGDLVRLRRLRDVANLPDGQRYDHWLSQYRPHNLDTFPDELTGGLSNATVDLFTRSAKIGAETVAVAELLWTQAALRSDKNHGVDQPPPAVAFLTGASMALEIAVLKPADISTDGNERDHNVEEHKVTVVFPALVTPPASSRCQLPTCRHWVWLALTLTSNGLSDALERAPDADSFVVLADREQCRAFLADLDHPVVVHLKGLPQLTLPQSVNTGTLAAALERTTGIELKPGQHFTLRHAIIGGDFLGMQQAWFESFLFPSTTGEWKHTRSVGLPRSFTSSDSPRFQRFWYMAGVGLEATPTRVQVTPRMSRSPLDRVNEELDPRIGVAVNRRIGDEESLLLRWSGIDVVTCAINQTVSSLKQAPL